MVSPGSARVDDSAGTILNHMNHFISFILWMSPKLAYGRKVHATQDPLFSLSYTFERIRILYGIGSTLSRGLGLQEK